MVIAVVGGAVVLYLGYSLVGGLSNNDIPDAPANTVQQPRETVPNEPSRAQSYVSFDDNFFQSGGDFFFRVSTGYDLQGNHTYSYIKAEIADAKTFRKVPVTGDLGVSSQKPSGGGTMPAFYVDSQHVYFFSGTSMQILQGADPNSFQVLSPTYAKDNNNVYVVHTECDTNGDCTGTVTVIPGANPDTFDTFHDTTVPDPDGSGTVVIDAKDDHNIYYYGVWVGPLPDPDDHTLHPETDHPVLISP